MRKRESADSCTTTYREKCCYDGSTVVHEQRIFKNGVLRPRN